MMFFFRKLVKHNGKISLLSHVSQIIASICNSLVLWRFDWYDSGSWWYLFKSSNGVNMLLVQKKMLSKAVALAFLTAVLLAMFLGKLSYFGMEQIRWISPKRSPKSWRNPGKSQKSLFYVFPLDVLVLGCWGCSGVNTVRHPKFEPLFR